MPTVRLPRLMPDKEENMEIMKKKYESPSATVIMIPVAKCNTLIDSVTQDGIFNGPEDEL